ncbi:MAG: TolC family protein [Bacteroidales bacterium]|nr:TolC family protein [Bacteroidales bacterium]
MNSINRVLIILFMIAAFPAVGQSVPDSVLSLPKAVQITMQRNYDIRIAKNNIRIAENNAGVLNTGYLPQLVGSAGGTYNKNNSDLTFFTGDKVSREGAVSKTYNAALGLNYRLFDGMNRHYNNKVLKADYSLSELQARAVIENTLIALVRSYYEVANLSARIENIKRTINISNIRYNYVKDQYFYGQATELDLLNSEVDLNNDSINFINTRRELELAENNLNVILSLEMDTPFRVDTLVNYAVGIEKELMLESALNRNVDYLIAQQNKNISDLLIKQSKSGYIPTLDINGNYGVSGLNSDLGNLLAQQSTGFTTGITLNWNLFDGGRTRTNELNARIALENSNQQLAQSKTELERQISDAYSNYSNALFVLRAEEKNKQTNRMNLSRSGEMFRLGQISSIDFRKAQVDLEDSINRYNEALYFAKIAELELMKLAGLFLDEL